MSTAIAAPETRTSISPEQQARRASHVDSANGHNAMEGAFPTPLTQAHQARYVAGEIDTQDEIWALKQHYGLA